MIAVTPAVVEIKLAAAKPSDDARAMGGPPNVASPGISSSI
jgi:hypothetical protein